MTEIDQFVDKMRDILNNRSQTVLDGSIITQISRFCTHFELKQYRVFSNLRKIISGISDFFFLILDFGNLSAHLLSTTPKYLQLGALILIKIGIFVDFFKIILHMLPQIRYQLSEETFEFQCWLKSVLNRS